MKHVAIIGAGAAGLTCLKSLLEVGIQPVVFEKSDRLGGLWNIDGLEPEQAGPAYRSLITNTSKQMMAFSDFPFPEEVTDFPSREEVNQYLQNYAGQFRLSEHIRFNTAVIQVKKEADERFSVLVESAGKQKIDTFDWLIVANGRHEKTVVPDFEGIETFKGTMLHSRDYFSPEPFSGKKVLVLGASSSAIDIASEVSEVSDSLYLSMRDPSWLVPRVINQKPYDLQLTKLTANLPKTFRERAFRNKLMKAYKQYSGKAIQHYFGSLNHALDLERHRFVPNDLLLSRVEKGKVSPRPTIKSISGNEVIFEDGSKETVDTIICATGYEIDIPFLHPSLTGLHRNYLPLYQQVFSPVTMNLAMCGMCYIVGPILPALEIQGRYLAEVIAGHVQLPSSTKMQIAVEQHRQQCKENEVNPMRVQTLSYLDEIAKEIGASPKLWLNFSVALQLLTGPMVAARYRLNGPKSNKALASKILKGLL